MTTVSRAILGLIRDNPQMIFTPKALQYEALKRNIPLSYEYAKKLLQRYAKRGILRYLERGQYIFSPGGDKRNHSKGQKGTLSRGSNHFKESKEITTSATKKGHSKGFFSEKSPPIRRQVFFIFYNNKRPFTVREVYSYVRDSRGNVSYRTVQSAINYFKSMGILGRKHRGLYFIKDWDLARSYVAYELEGVKGTPLGVEKSTDLIVVPHHFRIKKAVPLTKEEFSAIEPCIWFTEPDTVFINGMAVDVIPTGEGDRSHGLKIKAPGATYHVTYSYKKDLAKVMIYPERGNSWITSAERLFGMKFIERAIRIGISAHFALNLDEIKKVLFEGDEIKVTINKSDFGASGDLEFEGVTDEGAELAKKLLETKLEAVGEVVDVFESVKRRLAEIEARLYFMDKTSDIEYLKKRLETLENTIAEIKDHVVLHTRYINLVMKSMSPAGGVEGYA